MKAGKKMSSSSNLREKIITLFFLDLKNGPHLRLSLVQKQVLAKLKAMPKSKARAAAL